jgi:hypothetical protein
MLAIRIASVDFLLRGRLRTVVIFIRYATIWGIRVKQEFPVMAIGPHTVVVAAIAKVG